MCTDLARHLSNTPGLHWKLWIENERTGDCGGVYLFADEASAPNFLKEHSQRLESMGIKNIRAKLFDVNEDFLESRARQWLPRQQRNSKN